MGPGHPQRLSHRSLRRICACKPETHFSPAKTGRLKCYNSRSFTNLACLFFSRLELTELFPSCYSGLSGFNALALRCLRMLLLGRPGKILGVGYIDDTPSNRLSKTRHQNPAAENLVHLQTLLSLDMSQIGSFRRLNSPPSGICPAADLRRAQNTGTKWLIPRCITVFVGRACMLSQNIAECG